MIEPFIVFGGVLFWLITGILSLVTVCFMSFRHTGRALFTILAWAALVTLFTTADPINWIYNNWLYVLYGTTVYLSAGTLYMIIRWRLFCGQVARIYDEIRVKFLKSEGLSDMTAADQVQKDKLKNRVSGDYDLRNLGVDAVPLRVYDNKARVTAWLAFWPFSLADFILGDLLVQLVEGIVRTFTGFMQGISNRQFSKYTELD